MSNETTTSTLILLAAMVSSTIAPMFTSAAIMQPLITPFNLDVPNTKTMDLPVSGTITASVVSETGASTPQTLTDTKVTLTMKKVVVSLRPTVATMKFAAAGNMSRFVQLMNAACVKKYEQDALALAAGFSQYVDAGTAATVAKVIEAGYVVKASNIPTAVLDAVLSYGGSMDIAADIRTQTGAFYGNPNFDPQKAAGATGLKPGYMGQFFGMNWWESGNVGTSASNDDMMVINRDYALAGLYPGGSVPQFEVKTSEETELLQGNVIILGRMWYQVAEYLDGAGCWLKADT